MNKLLPHEITVRRADNGFLVSKTEESEYEENLCSEVQTVYEDTLDFSFCDGLEEFKPPYGPDIERLIAMYHLIHHIMDEFDCRYNKHRRVNLVLEFEVRDD